MENGNGASAPNGPPHDPPTLGEAWARELSPARQSAALASALDRFATRLPKLAYAALVALLIFVVILVGAAVLATSVEILRWAGLLPSHGNQLTMPHLIPPIGLASAAGSGGLWLRSRRKQHRSSRRTTGSDSAQPAARTRVRDHQPCCRAHGNDHSDEPRRTQACPAHTRPRWRK